jgi:hypothetical protein
MTKLLRHSPIVVMDSGFATSSRPAMCNCTSGMTGREIYYRQAQLLISADQVFSISLTTESGIGM